VSRLNKFIVMTVSVAGALAIIGGIIGTAKQWWRNGIDAEFLLLVTLLYCICVVVEHVCGKEKNND
jgi:hypothetical protein